MELNMGKLSFGMVLSVIKLTQNPVVKKLIKKTLINIATKTPNKIDDAVMLILYRSFAEGQQPTEDYLKRVEESIMKNVQAKFDEMVEAGAKEEKSELIDVGEPDEEIEDGEEPDETEPETEPDKTPDEN